MPPNGRFGESLNIWCAVDNFLLFISEQSYLLETLHSKKMAFGNHLVRARFSAQNLVTNFIRPGLTKTRARAKPANSVATKGCISMFKSPKGKRNDRRKDNKYFARIGDRRDFTASTAANLERIRVKLGYLFNVNVLSKH